MQVGCGRLRLCTFLTIGGSTGWGKPSGDEGQGAELPNRGVGKPATCIPFGGPLKSRLLVSTA
jgi:hypothetical protein